MTPDPILTPHALELAKHEVNGRFPGGCLYCGARLARHTPEELEACAAKFWARDDGTAQREDDA